MLLINKKKNQKYKFNQSIVIYEFLEYYLHYYRF